MFSGMQTPTNSVRHDAPLSRDIASKHPSLVNFFLSFLNGTCHHDPTFSWCVCSNGCFISVAEHALFLLICPQAPPLTPYTSFPLLVIPPLLCHLPVSALKEIHALKPQLCLLNSNPTSTISENTGRISVLEAFPCEAH